MKQSSRSVNGFRNILAELIHKAVMFVFPFITRACIVKILGENYLGLSSLYTSILTVLNLADLGFGGALVFSMYKPIAENNRELIGALLNTYRKIYYAIGAVLLSCGLVICPFIPRLINGELPQGINVYVLYLLYLGNTIASYVVLGYKKAVLTAYQRTDILSITSMIVNIVLYGTQLILLATTRNYYLYVFMFPVFTILDNVISSIIVDKIYPELKCGGSISAELKGKIKQHVKGIALQKVCSTSRNAFDSIVTSMFLGLNMTARYNNYFYVMSSTHLITYLIPNSIRASVGDSIAREVQNKNYEDYCNFSLMYGWLCSFFCTCLFTLFQPFMKLWMGDNSLLPVLTMSLFCTYFMLLSLVDINALYRDAAGLWWQGRYRTVVEASANLILNFVMGKYWGINGILLATNITICLSLFYEAYIIYKYYFTEQNYSDFLIWIVKSLLLTVVSILTTYGICSIIPDFSNFVNILVRIPACVIVPNVIWFVFYFRSKRFKKCCKFAGNLISSVCARK